MKDGLGRKVNLTSKAIKKVLKGDTSYVATDDDVIVITYNEEQGEIDISCNEIPFNSFELKELNEAVSEFMELVERRCIRK